MIRLRNRRVHDPNSPRRLTPHLLITFDKLLVSVAKMASVGRANEVSRHLLGSEEEEGEWDVRGGKHVEDETA